MTIISGIRRQIRELADGTLEVKVHIDPANKKDFLELFPDIDLPLAMARLTVESSKESMQAETIKPKGGELAKLAGIFCKDPKFWEWLNNNGMSLSIDNEADAVELIYDVCEIDSRTELDNNKVAEDLFHKYIRIPFSNWLKEQ